jgi:RNA polymerase sigma factor (sigma-70 family)
VIEQDIIKGCINNERLAQKQLYERFYGKMVGICMRYASHREQAIEVVNMGFFKVFKTMESFAAKGGNLEAWIYRIMVNTAIDYLRAETRHRHDDIEKSVFLEDHSDIIADMNAEQILELLNQLPPSYRTVFNLYVVEGYNHNEIGEMLGISEGTSKSNLFKAKQKLQEMLEKVNSVKLANHGK